MIREGSRYQTGTLVQVADSTGVYHRTIFRSVSPQTSQSYTTYVWQDGDRLDALAAKKLNDSELWWMLLDVNPEITDPLSIEAGTVIRIPNGIFSA